MSFYEFINAIIIIIIVMFLQGHPTTKVDSIGDLWLKVKEIKTYIKTTEKPTTLLQINKLNDLILNLTPENTTQHSRIE